MEYPMAAPTVTAVYPANGDTGIPIGAQPYVEFTGLVDKKRIIDSFIIHGTEEQFVTGPFLGLHDPPSEHRSDYYLTTPGLRGVVKKSIDIKVYSSGTEYTGALTDESQIGSLTLTTRVYFQPDELLGHEQTYEAILIGDQSNGLGVSKQTVYDAVAGGGNTGTGSMRTYGGYTGTGNDTVNITITSSGAPGYARFSWYYSSDPGTVRSNLVAQRRYQLLGDGIQIAFRGSSLQSGDTFSFNVYSTELLAANYKWSFTTNDGNYTEVPESPSTPAESLPPASILPSTAGSSSLSLVSSVPQSGHYRVDPGLDTITIEFGADIDPATVTADTVQVLVHPALGLFAGQSDVKKLATKLVVSGSTLTIEF
jgi:hypothetical protein